MNATEWNDLLDTALNRLESEPLADILADYSAQAGELRPLLSAATSLEALWPVTMPSAEDLDFGRQAFLDQVEQLPAKAVSSPMAISSPMAVSLPLPVRLKGWITTQLSQILALPYTSKEVKNMNAFLLKAALVIVMLFGAAGGTAALSAESLPDSILYPVKLSLEETRLALTADPTKEAELNLALADTRLQEITEMSLAGKASDEAIFIRFEKHFDEALRLAAQMPEDAMAGFLVQTRDRIQSQEHDLTRARARVSGPGEEALEQANGLLTRLRLQVEYGLQEPQLFRRQNGRMPEGAPREAGPCSGDDCEPPGSSNQFGPGPVNQEQNGPGNGYGPGDGSGVCVNSPGCEPAGDANQYGPGAANQASNGPGDGSGVCVNSPGCEPAGDANQYGPGPGMGNENTENPGNVGQSGPQSGQNNSHKR